MMAPAIVRVLWSLVLACALSGCADSTAPQAADTAMVDRGDTDTHTAPADADDAEAAGEDTADGSALFPETSFEDGTADVDADAAADADTDADGNIADADREHTPDDVILADIAEDPDSVGPTPDVADPTDVAATDTAPTPDTTPEPPLTATFSVDSTTLAPDAERGFFKWGGEIDALTASDLTRIYNTGARLTYVMIRLDAYRATAIDTALLNTITTGLGRVRAAGLKAIVRVTYNYPDNETEYQNAQDAPLSQVLAHIASLGPVFTANADVIAFFQAGFIGAWGEWHTSSNNLATEAPRTAIKDALLAHLPASRTVSFRNPPYLRTWYPALPDLATRLAATTPGIGFHNDCFLASASDVGTYPSTDRQALRDHMKALGRLYPFGGETCDPDDTSAARMTCDDILTEGADYGLTYLNRDYWQGFHDSWLAGGCLDDVSRRMGHRLAVTRLELPARAAAAATIAVHIGLANGGWARPHNPRPLVLALTQGATTRQLTVVGVDLRRIGRGETVDFVGELRLPADLAKGAWTIAIMAPDAAQSLRDDPRYAARLFNTDAPQSGQRWDAAAARFETGLTLTVE